MYLAPAASFLVIAAPHPDECISQRLVEYLLIAMPRRFAKHEAIIVPLGLQRRGRPLVGHHPIVISLLRILGSIVVLRDMREDSERLLLAVLDQLHAGVIFPRA